ncbi:hypothetical protein L1887_20478 [Cichorium endivia]|nr:hypothetical protein L1887_20478 [Cichorium endivia]
MKLDARWMGAFSLGIDLGLCRTDPALSEVKDSQFVLELRGQKLEKSLLELLINGSVIPHTGLVLMEVDEFIIGLPVSSDGKETAQSNKVCSVGRIAIWAAERPHQC